MKKLADVAIIVGVISLIAGVASRLIMKPVAGIYASAFLQFAGVCLLLGIALVLREK
ncbi:MAG: hypothetical protein JW800_03950 [Candidatus Omnitrophica bacterium]|nr:hypothetical protein [Candidatus Omnitrophota bacterium]